MKESSGRQKVVLIGIGFENTYSVNLRIHDKRTEIRLVISNYLDAEIRNERMQPEAWPHRNRRPDK